MILKVYSLSKSYWTLWVWKVAYDSYSRAPSRRMSDVSGTQRLFSFEDPVQNGTGPFWYFKTITNKHMYIHTYMPIYMRMYKPKSIHAYVGTYILGRFLCLTATAFGFLVRRLVGSMGERVASTSRHYSHVYLGGMGGEPSGEWESSPQT